MTISVKPLKKVCIEDLFQYLISLDTKDAALENMWDRDWENKENSLPYMLLRTNKFDGVNGEFHVILDGDKIVGCGGVQIAPFHNRIAICGVRTWLDPEYRNQMLIAKKLLPVHKRWAIKQGCKQIALTFNEYNRHLTRPFTRIRLGENKNRIKRRTPNMMFYNGVNELDYMVTIQYTPQWVIYEKLDKKWQFNWQYLRSK